jgi:NTP pyrophosphatase (non-canonical NTP hydrolase)
MDKVPHIRPVRQELVFDWVTKAFGPDHANSLPQRATRFLEEAIELYQAAGGDRDMAHRLLDFVFARPVGELSKEIGAVGLTLLSVAAAADVSADAEERREIERVTSQDPAVFAERNREKNEAGFDAGSYSVEGCAR